MRLLSAPCTFLCLLAAAAGCAPNRLPVSGAASRAPAPVRIPDGCGGNLSGAYVHNESPAFRYRGVDDGGTLDFTLTRPTSDAGGDDGGRPPESGVRISLQRSAEGFIGSTQAEVYNSAGHLCPVAFPTEVIGCDDAGLTLRSTASAAIDDSCRSPPRGPTPVRVTQRLLRESSSPRDAGREP